MATFSHMAVIAALFLIVLVNLAPIYVRAAEIVYEEGYTVTTVLDGHKKGLNPHSVLPQSLYSSDLFVLDSSRNAFYTVSFPDSRESVIKKYSGNGMTGFSDGELASAKFNKPKSFTVDFRGNIYVADKNNHAIRKISNSGVTTIAGGSSQTPGNADGPARNASFSNDFELSFSPERCALMISDHGNMLLRQINLRAENCANGSQSVQGMTSAWAWALGFACLLGGLIIGFVIRPYVVPYECSGPLQYSETWKHFLISLGRKIPTLCFELRSAVVSSTSYAHLMRIILLILSYLSLMFSLNVVVDSRKPPPQKPKSLLDDDDLRSSMITKSEMFAEQVKDLISFDGGLQLSHPFTEVVDQTDDTKSGDGLCNTRGKIERMINRNIIGFTEQAEIISPGDQVDHCSSLFKMKYN